MISGSAGGMPNSEALSSSCKAAASKVSFLFGHTSSRETGVGHQPIRRENLSGEIQDESEESQLAEPTDDAEAVAIFGRFKVSSFIVITLNHDYNSMCRKKKRSLFH